MGLLIEMGLRDGAQFSFRLIELHVAKNFRIKVLIYVFIELKWNTQSGIC